MDVVKELTDCICRDLNQVHKYSEPELLFHEAYMQWCKRDPMARENLIPQAEIGPYRVDYLYKGLYVVEIDGHEFHSTKEQRQHDYERERYLLKNGYKVVRFTGADVINNPMGSVTSMMEIVYSQKNVWEDFLIDQKQCS